MNPLFGQLLQGFGGSVNSQGQGQFNPQGQQQSMPGQESMNMDLSGLIGALGQAQPRSGAIGLPQQMDQMQAPMVLPPLNPPEGVDMGGIMPLPDLRAELGFGPSGGQSPWDDPVNNPLEWQNPGAQQRPMSTQDGATTGIPNPTQPQGNPGEAQGMGQGINWGSLMNMTGTMDNPNALVRMGRGYNDGGLIGALGYLLTDMSKQAAGTTQQGF